MVFSSGCYYGVLNVIDPTIQYDANGKVVGALRLPLSSQHSGTYSYHSRESHNETRDQSTNLRTRAEEVVIVETVESVQSRMDDSYQQGFHPEITYVSETDMLGMTVPEEEPILIQEPAGEPEPEPEPLPELLMERIQESTQEVLNVESSDMDRAPVEEQDGAPHDETAKEETAKEKQYVADESLEAPVIQASVSALSHTVDNGEELQFETTLEEPELEYLEAVPEAQNDGKQTERSDAEQTEAASHQPKEQAIVDLVEEPEPEEVVDLVEETASVVDLAQESKSVVDLVQGSGEEAPEDTAPTPEQGARSVTEHHEPTFVEEPKLTPVVLPENSANEKQLFVEESKNAEDPQSMVLVAGYMEATPLFKTIQRKNWQAVLFFLRTGSFSFSPLTGTAMTHAVQQQTQTWVSKKDESGKELWRQLPLHAAICYGASQKVVEKLIIAYPEALRSSDCHGNLPLHLAYIFDGEDSVLSLLMKTFPAALHVMNFQGLQPIQCSNEISSETFQYNAELFGALSDYTRAVAENDPDKLTEQLQEVRKQLKQVNDTVFASAAPRKPDLIKEYMKSAPAPASASQQQVENALVPVEYGPVAAYGPSAFLSEVALGLCSGNVKKQVEQEMASQYAEPQQQPKSWAGRGTPKEIIVLDDVPMPAPQSCPVITPQSCRVMEYCAETKTWKEV